VVLIHIPCQHGGSLLFEQHIIPILVYRFSKKAIRSLLSRQCVSEPFCSTSQQAKARAFISRSTLNERKKVNLLTKIQLMDINHWGLIVNICILAVYIILASIGYVQLRNLRREKKIEFGYTLYNDFFQYINAEKNKDLKDWLFGKGNKIEDVDRIGDLLEKLEAVYTYRKQGMVNDELFYDLFSFYIEKVFAAKNPSGAEYIAHVREIEKGNIVKTNDIFIGVEIMFEKIKKESPDRKEPPLK
jgi:hypothetical protein